MAEIRYVTANELSAWLRARRTTFLADRALLEGELDYYTSFLDPLRTFGAWAGAECVATLMTFPSMLTIPGSDGGVGSIAADAVTGVTVAATHRRQGLLSAMLTRSLGEAKDRGEVVSVLRAAEWPIYGRFGYWPASWIVDYRLRCDRSAAITGSGDVTLRGIEPDEAAVVGPSLYELMGEHNVGQISRNRSQWQRRLGLDGVRRSAPELICVLASDAAGVAQGLLTWTSLRQGEHDPVDVLVHDLIAASASAYASLCSYLLHLDLVAGVQLPERAEDEPLQWLLTDGRLLRQTRREDDLWLRILDVPAALSARRYAVTDRLTLQVVDTDVGGFAAGRYVLDAGPSHADCVPIAALSTDLTVSQRALAAVYLGGNTVASQVYAGLIDEHTPGALHRFSAMMQTDKRPWNPTEF
jgi:predicted acetyltransferase